MQGRWRDLGSHTWRGRRGAPGVAARLTGRVGGWPARRVGMAAVASALLLSAAWLGQIAPLLAQEGVGIRFDDLTSQPTHTTVHRFGVALSNRDAATTYTVRVASDNPTALGLGGCDTASQTQSVTGGTAQDLSFVVYACALGAGTLTAEVHAAGAATAAASVSQALTVLAIPEGAPAGVPGAPAASAATRGATKAGTPGMVPSISFPTKTSTSIKVTWGAPSNGGRRLTGYGLLFWRKGAQQPPWRDALVKGTAPREHTYTGLRPNTTYRFRIHACNGTDSCGRWTHPPKEASTARTPTAAPTTAAPTSRPTAAPTVGPPGRPQNVSIPDPGATAAEVRWRAADNTGGAPLTGFGILWWPNGAREPPHNRAAVVGKASRAYTMTGLTAATTYRVKLRACNGPNRCSAWSTDQRFTTDPATATPTATATAAPPAGAPGPVRNLKHTGSGKHTVSVSWQAPTSNGRAALTGFHVQHRIQDTAWPQGSDVVNNRNARAWTIRGMINGTRYDVQVRACNAAPLCGAWTALPNPVTAGNKVGNASLIPSSATIRVGQRQKFEIHDIPVGKTARTYLVGPIQPEGRCRTSGASTQGRGPSTGSGYYDSLRIEGCAPGGTGWLRVVNADESELYASAKITVQAAATTPDPEPGPGDPPSTEPGEPTPIEGCGSVAPGALATPTTLAIIPYPQRRALLTWVGSEAATHYSARITRVDTSTSVTGRVENRPCWQINLDNILGLNSPQGLAHATAFQFEVTAQVIAPDGTVSNSEGPSETVTLIDNPILSINSNSKGTADGKGQAVVRWSKITGATNYTIMYRELPGFHWSPGWTVSPPTASHPRTSIEVAAASAVTDPNDNTKLTYTIGGTTNTANPLTRNELYALSINYQKQGVKYFAAREAYVWPSARPAGNGERVGSFPLVQMIPNKAYRYYICEDTFPAGTLNVRREAWVSLITDAVDQWESASQGLITGERVEEPCVSFDSVVTQLASDIRRHITKWPGLSDEKVREFARALITRLRRTGAVRGTSTLLANRNEILMYNDVDGALAYFREVDVFPELASDLGYRCWYEGRKYLGNVPMCVQADYSGGTWRSDIIVRRSHYEDDRLLLPKSNAQFNTCPRTQPGHSDASTTDTFYEAFTHMVHEVGHAMGIRGGSSIVWTNPGHPQVPDSVMNYDFVAVSKDPERPPLSRADFDGSFSEPDCTPHPLDVMAIYALYQTK